MEFGLLRRRVLARPSDKARSVAEPLDHDGGQVLGLAGDAGAGAHRIAILMLEMRRRLGLPERGLRAPPMAIGVEWRGEAYGLLIDEIGDVLTLPAARCEPAPANLDARLAGVAAGVHRLDDGLMMVLDVDRVVDGASGD